MLWVLFFALLVPAGAVGWAIGHYTGHNTVTVTAGAATTAANPTTTAAAPTTTAESTCAGMPQAPPHTQRCRSPTSDKRPTAWPSAALRSRTSTAEKCEALLS